MTTVRVVDGDAVALAANDPGGRSRARGAPVQAGASGALLVFVLFGLPAVLDGRWLQVMTSVAIYSIVTLGLGLLIGRAGMVSLSQFLQLAMGAWVALRLAYATDLPFPVLVLAAGLITGVIGALIGLPALRLSGLYLALITLMAAGAITVVLKIAQFPNGGGGFFGNSAAGGASSRLARPAIATGNTAYFRYCVVVAGLMFLLALWHIRSKPGRAWAALRQSQVTAIAAGVNTTLYRLWAFALASFMAGVAGALLAAASGGVNINQFPVQNSILLFAVVLMGGVYNIWGAVVAALLLRLLPALLDQWGVSTELLTILFGIGILQVLLTAPGGLVDQVPKDLANLARRLRNLTTTEVERADVEPAEVERAEVERTDVEPAEVEPAEVERAGTEPAEVERTDVEPAEVERTDVERAGTEPVEPPA